MEESNGLKRVNIEFFNIRQFDYLSQQDATKASVTVDYRKNSMYWDRSVSANSADQDQTASEEAV